MENSVMHKVLNTNDIPSLTESQKSELFDYMNFLVARNNAVFSLAHMVFGLVLIVIVLLYVRPTLNALVNNYEFTPVMLVFALWMALPAAIAILAVALIGVWKNRAWNFPLYNFGVNQARANFNEKYGLDISELSVKKIWAATVCKD
jgi:hypothetical protein